MAACAQGKVFGLHQASGPQVAPAGVRGSRKEGRPEPNVTHPMYNGRPHVTWAALEKALPGKTCAPWGPASPGGLKSETCQTPPETVKFAEASGNSTSAGFSH